MQIDTDKIKQIMKKRNLTAYDLSLAMGKRESWVYSVLAGTTGKTFKTVESFADALKINPKNIIK